MCTKTQTVLPVGFPLAVYGDPFRYRDSGTVTDNGDEILMVAGPDQQDMIAAVLIVVDDIVHRSGQGLQSCFPIAWRNGVRSADVDALIHGFHMLKHGQEPVRSSRRRCKNHGIPHVRESMGVPVVSCRTHMPKSVLSLQVRQNIRSCPGNFPHAADSILSGRRRGLSCFANPPERGISEIGSCPDLSRTRHRFVISCAGPTPDRRRACMIP